MLHRPARRPDRRCAGLRATIGPANARVKAAPPIEPTIRPVPCTHVARGNRQYTTAMPTELPYLTSSLPGTGGVIKRFHDDFVVDEVPLYPPSGEGTHVYFQIEKRGLTTLAAIHQVARALGKRSMDIGYAGLKDAHGVTRQWMSVEHVPAGQVESLQCPHLTVLQVTRHTNKLKLGHLAGNKFVIRVRDACPDALCRAKPIAEVMRTRGMPNYFGPQRFGVRGDNAAIGHAVLRGEYEQVIALIIGKPNDRDNAEIYRARELFDAGQLDQAERAWPARGFAEQKRVCRAYAQSGGNAKKAWRAVNHVLRKLYMSAFQSELFNCVVAERIHTADRVETGDVAYKHANGACFLVEDDAAEQPRCASFEISPTGPIFGRKMKLAAGAQAALENRILARTGIQLTDIDSRGSGKLDGARRPLRVPLADAEVSDGSDDRGPFLELSFALPPGSYATSALREITKT